MIDLYDKEKECYTEAGCALDQEFSNFIENWLAAKMKIHSRIELEHICHNVIDFNLTFLAVNKVMKARIAKGE